MLRAVISLRVILPTRDHPERTGAVKSRLGIVAYKVSVNIMPSDYNAILRNFTFLRELLVFLFLTFINLEDTL